MSEKRLQSAKDAVVKHAVCWVMFDDRGTVSDLYKESAIREALVKAVLRLEKQNERKKVVRTPSR